MIAGVDTQLIEPNSSFKKMKMSTDSPIKASIDFGSNSIQNIKIKQYNFEASNPKMVTPKMPSIDRNEESVDIYSTISSNEFKEVINTSIHEAVLRSK